jgi:fatty acid synthase subunit alpha, fungi type
MVAGMTPTTVKAGFVSAVLEAGYHVELAGGGHYSPATSIRASSRSNSRHTSPSVKDLIVAAAGVDNSQWEGTYVKDTGGIVTVLYELGEPFHKSTTVLSNFGRSTTIPCSNFLARNVVPGSRSIVRRSFRGSMWIISKSWFPTKKDGQVVRDLGDMTYEETVLLFVRLL